MQFFTSPKDLESWVRQEKTSDVAAQKFLQVIGSNNEKDIVDTCRGIFSGDVNAANVLFEILKKHNLTQMREGKNMTDKLIKEAQMMRQDSVYGDLDLKVCPKLPYSVGKRLISTYNCRHYCLDSMVLDEEPNKVYCVEALWRRHVMDKFSREFKDKDGKWVGGYINERFQTFKDDGGNQMQLANGERTRKPRPHQYSTERRLEEARGEETHDITASSNKFVKLASVETKDATKIDKIFGDIIDMKEAGISDEDIIYRVAEHYNETIPNVASVHKLAMKSLKSHNGIVYAHNNSLKKNAQVTFLPRSTVRAIQEIPVICVAGSKSFVSLPMGETAMVELERYQNKTVFNYSGNKFILPNNIDEKMVFETLDDEHGMIQDAADETGLNEGASTVRGPTPQQGNIL